MAKDIFTYEQIKNALIKAKGFISQTAKTLNCSHTTIHNYLERYPELRDVLKEARTEMLDFAENALLSKIKDKDTTSIIFFLKTQGKSRGYQEKQDIEISAKELNFELTEERINAAKQFFKTIE